MSNQTPNAIDFAAHADKVAEWNRTFFPMDFTPASIAALDSFITEMWGDSGTSPDSEQWQPTDGMWNTILNFGIYVGEVLLRRYGGHWEQDEQRPGNLLAARLVLPGGLQAFPVSKVWRRFKNGREDDLEPLFREIRRQMADEAREDEWRDWLKQGEWLMGVKRPDLAIRFFQRASVCPLGDDNRNLVEEALQRAKTAAAAETAKPPGELSREAVPTEQITPKKEPPTEVTRQQAWVARVRKLLAGQDRDSAFTCLQQALAELPDDPELNELMGDQLAFRKDIPGAMAAFEKATKRWVSAHAWEGLGICRNLTGNPEGAIAAWQEAAICDKKRAAPCHRLALIEEQRGNKLKALEWFQQVVARNPPDPKMLAQAQSRITVLENDPVLLHEQADRLAGQGDTAGSIAVYERIVALTPADSEAWREAGVGYALLQQFDTSLECFDKAVKVNPRDHLAWDFKAVALARMGKFPLALAVIDDGLAYCLDAAQLWWRRSFLLTRLNRHQEAIAAANKALELDPEDGTSYLFRFEAQRQLGQTAEALESIARHIAWIHPRDYRKGIESMRLKWGVEHPDKPLDSEGASQLQDEAFYYWQTGDTSKALQAYRAATEHDPFSFEIWNNYGSSLSGLGRYEEAIACFDHAAALNPLITDFLRNKAVALARLNRLDDALACHEQVLEKSPKNSTSLEARARLLGALERWEQSLAAAETFAGICPQQTEAFVLTSWALGKLARHEEALIAIDKAIALSPDDRTLWLNKSVILDTLERDDEALELQSRAFEDKEFADRYHREGLELFRMMGI